MEKIKVFVVDDHEMFREGVKMLLSKTADFEIVGFASNGKECVDSVPENTDIVLMDISMPEMNGIEATQKVLQKYSSLKIIALSMFGDEEYYYKMIHSGVKGFVLKEAGSKDLEKAIRDVQAGKNFFSHELLRNIIVSLDEKEGTSNENNPKTITQNEHKVLQLICSGFSNNEIAEKLEIKNIEVENHEKELLLKTKTKSTVNLIMYAIKHSIISIN